MRNLANKTSGEVTSETSSDYNSANAYDALRIIPGVSFMTGQGGRTGQEENAMDSDKDQEFDDYSVLAAKSIFAGHFSASAGLR